MKYFELPRGLRDYDPESYLTLERIRDVFVKNSTLYGYNLMEPASIELLDTLKAKSGEEVVNEIYAFKDKAGRDLGLRFDLTVGITRYVCSRRDIPLPFRAASFAGVWRYDEPQFGRYRWFYQWDVEEYGVSKDQYDYLELLSLVYRVFRDLGINDLIIKVNDRRVVEAALTSIMGRVDDGLLRAIDKLGKKEKGEIISEYVQKGYNEEDVRAALDLADADLNSIPAISERAGELLRLLDLSKSMNIPVKFDLSVVRGLDYYTDIVFEAYSTSKRDVGALAGGGGYDVLPSLFGRPELKALGAAGGVDRIALVVSGASAPKISVAVCYLEQLRERAMAVSEILRDYGVPARLMRPAKLSTQLSDAEKGYFRLAVLVLPEELSRGQVKVKDLLKREEAAVDLNALGPYIQERLK